MLDKTDMVNYTKTQSYYVARWLSHLGACVCNLHDCRQKVRVPAFKATSLNYMKRRNWIEEIISSTFSKTLIFTTYITAPQSRRFLYFSSNSGTLWLTASGWRFACRMYPLDRHRLWNSHMSNDHRISELEISRLNGPPWGLSKQPEEGAGCLLFPQSLWGGGFLGSLLLLCFITLMVIKGPTNLACLVYISFSS